MSTAPAAGRQTPARYRLLAAVWIALLAPWWPAQLQAQTPAEPPGAPANSPPPGDVPAAGELPPTAAPPPPSASEPSSSELAAEIAELRSELAKLKGQADDAASELTLQEVSEPEVTITPPLLRVYGFMDFGFDKFFLNDVIDDGVGLLRPSPASSFVFGNLNLYFDARPLEHLHTLVEVRLTVAPHGEEVGLGPPLDASYERIDTVAFDFSSPSSQAQLRLGGIYIERAWAEYEFSELLHLQWGMLLTPFGIWNLDHGSPTLITLVLPTFVAAQMMPTRLLGVHVYGSAFFGPHEIGYALHVSNGRSPLEVDLSEDKAVGGRLFWASETPIGRLVLGSSVYIGHYEDKQKKLDVRDDFNLFNWDTTVAYDEQVLGFDVALDIDDFRLRSEAVLRWIEYDANKHERIFTGGTAGYLPNRLEWDVYALMAYRTPFRIEPFLQWESAHKSYQLPRFSGASRQTPVGPISMDFSAGFNIEITTHTLFKAQVAHTLLTNNKTGPETFSVWSIFTRVVSSF
jgi:hypothetical protein